MKLEILHEDADLIAVNKPANVLTIPDRFDASLKNLRTILRDKYGDIFIVHRLDKETSGVMLFARNAETHKTLNEAFSGREVNKTYLAIAQKPGLASGVIEENIAESPRAPGRYEIRSKGKAAITEYEVIETFRNYALLKVKILTGRTHQIRVHLKHVGAPLLVDSKYGMAEAFYLSSIKRLRKRPDQERPLISRCSLHAHVIQLKHPTTEETVSFTAEPPKDIRATLNQMRKNLNTV